MALNIDDPKDTRLGYLSYKKEEPFEIDQLIWPSVERYLLAQQFSGTPLEEKIRLSGNISVVSKLVKPYQKTEILPNGFVIKKTYYRHGEPKKVDLASMLAKAIESKFKKSEDRLIKTFPLRFESLTHPEYADILTRYRDRLYATKVKEGKSYLDVTSDLKDLKLWNRLIKITEDYVSKLKKIDHVKKLHPGLYDDALWNMAPHGKVQKIMEHLDPTRIIKEMPRQQELVSRSYAYLGKKFPDKINNPEFQHLVAKMWATFRWQILHHQKTGDKYHWKLKKSKLSLRPVPRPYRKSKIKAPHLRSLEVRTQEYIQLFGGTDEYDEMVRKYEKMKPMVRDQKIDRLLAALKAKETKSEVSKKSELKVKLEESEEEPEPKTEPKTPKIDKKSEDDTSKENLKEDKKEDVSEESEDEEFIPSSEESFTEDESMASESEGPLPVSEISKN